MMFEEILIDGVFVTALLTGIACLLYVLYATILERHLLRARQDPRRASAARAVSSPAATLPRSATAPWQRGPGSPALPQGRS